MNEHAPQAGRKETPARDWSPRNGPQTTSTGDCADDASAYLATESALDSYWLSLTGSLRRLNLKREAVEDLLVVVGGYGAAYSATPVWKGKKPVRHDLTWHPPRASVSQPDSDPAPFPDGLRRAAGRAFEALHALDQGLAKGVTLLNSTADRLRLHAEIWAPKTRESRARVACENFAASDARLARECLELATAMHPDGARGSPTHGRLHAVAGLALAGSLAAGTDPQRREWVNQGLEGLLAGLAVRTTLDPRLREAALAGTRMQVSVGELADQLNAVLGEPSTPMSGSTPPSPVATVPIRRSGRVLTEFMPKKMLEIWRWLASRWGRQRAPTQDDVAVALKMSPRTVRKYLHKLAGLGHVELDQRSRITRVAAPPTGTVH